MTKALHCLDCVEKVKDSKDHVGHELTEEDPLDFRVLLPRYNKFTIGEWHYFISGYMISTIKWITIFFFLFALGVIKLGA